MQFRAFWSVCRLIIASVVLASVGVALAADDADWDAVGWSHPNVLPDEAYHTFAPGNNQRDLLRAGHDAQGRAVAGVHVALDWDVDLTLDAPDGTASGGAWQTRADGSRVWAAVVSADSADAAGLRLEFAHVDLPNGVELWVVEPNGTSHGPLSNAPSAWTPVIRDTLVTIEVRVPASGATPRDARLRFAISQLVVLGGPHVRASRSDRGSGCLIPTPCSIWPFAKTAESAVALILVPTTTTSIIGTAFYVDDLNETSHTPFMLTSSFNIDNGSPSTLNGTIVYSMYADRDCTDETAWGLFDYPSAVGISVDRISSLESGVGATLFRPAAGTKLPVTGTRWLKGTNVPPGEADDLYLVSFPSGYPARISKAFVIPTPPGCGNFNDATYETAIISEGGFQPGSTGGPIMTPNGVVVGIAQTVCSDACSGNALMIYSPMSDVLAVHSVELGTGDPAPAPDNDAFESAIPLAPTQISSFQINTSGASRQPGEGSGPGPDGIEGRSIWYTLTAPVNGTLRLSTTGSGFDPLLCQFRVEGGDTVDTIDFVNFFDNDDEGSRLVADPSAEFAIERFVNYAFLVDGTESSNETSGGPVSIRAQFHPNGIAPVESSLLQITGGAAQFGGVLKGYVANLTNTYNASGTITVALSGAEQVDDSLPMTPNAAAGRFALAAKLRSSGDNLTDVLYVDQSGGLYDFHYRRPTFADVTGGGRFDDAYPVGRGYFVRANDGWWLHAMDVNSDGFDDVVQMTPYGIVWVSIGTSEGFDPPYAAATLGFLHKESAGWWTAPGDFNGDGADDLICVTPFRSVYVALNRYATNAANPFGSPQFWGFLGFYFDRPTDWTLHVGDFDGDGDDDLGQLTQYKEFWVAISSRLAPFGNPTNWNPLGFSDNGSTTNTWATDMNGDGSCDLLHQTAFGEFWYVTSNGASMLNPIRLRSLGLYHNVNGPNQILIGNF